MDSLLKCPLCIANGGRLTKGAHCCEVRKLADAPQHVRKAHFDALRIEQGKDAANQLIAEVDAEMIDRRKLKAKLIEQAMVNVRKITGGDSGTRNINRQAVTGNRSAGIR